MQIKAFLALASAALPAIARPTTQGYATVVNKTPQVLYVMSVSSVTGTTEAIQPGKSWSEPLHYDPQTGIAIKVATTKTGFYNAKPQLIWGYTLNNAENSIYYDLSTTYGLDALFKDSTITLSGDAEDFQSIVWKNLQETPAQSTNAYVGDSLDMTLTIQT